MTGALTRFRVMAWICGILLLILTLVAMPMKYFAQDGLLVQIVAPIHGWCFVVYLVATADLARRVQWQVTRILLVCLAGTVPFFSFYMERKVRQWILGRELRTASAGS